MTRKTYLAILFAASTALSVPAYAGVTFIPPSDTTGKVFTTDTNDAYGGGRGVVFAPTSPFSLTSVGIRQDLTNVVLSYSVALATNSTGQVGGGTVLASGSRNVTTNGLQFVTFSFASLSLAPNTFYHVQFLFGGNSNQNFFYDQRGAEPYAQSGFIGIDGTQDGNTSNFVIPAIQLNGSTVAAVPEPATWAMMIGGFGIVGGAMRRRRTSVSFGRAA